MNSILNGSGKLTRKEIIRYGVLAFVFLLFLMPALALIYVSLIATYFLIRLLWLGLVAITRIRLPKRKSVPVVYAPQPIVQLPQPEARREPTREEKFCELLRKHEANTLMIGALPIPEDEKDDARTSAMRTLLAQTEKLME